MGNIVIKCLDEFYPEDRDITKLCKYIAGECPKKEKVRYCKGRGVPSEPEKAANRMIQIQKHYGKATQRRIYHYIVSFPEETDDVNGVVVAAERVAGNFFETNQVYYGVHEDTDDLHIHFAVNAVSYRDGKKWHSSKKEFEILKDQIRNEVDEILRSSQ